MLLKRFLDGFGDLGPAQSTLEESLDRHFVGRRHECGRRPSDTSGLVRQIETSEGAPVRRCEIESLQVLPIDASERCGDAMRMRSRALALGAGLEADLADLAGLEADAIFLVNPNNPTYLNGERLRVGVKRPLAPGATIRLGQGQIVFTFNLVN